MPVADPRRGTRVALGFSGLAVLGTGLSVAVRGPGITVSAVALAALLFAALVAERISIQLGPRSWYTPSTPVIVLAGLLAGPLGGALVGASAQLGVSGHVWRRRLAEGGLGSLQGLVAGTIGLAASVASPAAAVAAAGVGMAAAVAINTAGRGLILVERRARPLLETWTQGIVVDAVDAVIATPILAVLLLTAPESLGLVVAVVLSLIGALAIAHRVRTRASAQLAAEQTNARRDALTGAPNRRAFEEALAAAHARVVRGDQPLGLFVVDLDRFKSVNDRFGHDVGDELLVAVVARLTGGLRAADLVARWGGEELTVLAPGIRTARGLEQFGERIRALVGDEPYAVRRNVVSLTASVGGTILDGAEPAATALARADHAMYEAKRDRDRVAVSLRPRPTMRLQTA